MDGTGFRPVPANGRQRFVAMGAVRPLLVVEPAAAFDQHLASAWLRDHSRFSSLSRSLPLKLSTKSSCQGLPGAMNAGLIAASRSQRITLAAARPPWSSCCSACCRPPRGASGLAGTTCTGSVRAMSVPSWGAVMQDDQLFAGSVADNISFFDPEMDQARIEHAARLAAVHDEIAAMPMGYHSLIGDMGSSLSGGQKQRVILARALYRHPKLLFLDEATSHLDVMKERLVNDAVKALELTKVIVAHRPETIASADRVLVMEQGRIIQELRPQQAPAESVTVPI